jgi:hypothetical protein
MTRRRLAEWEATDDARRLAEWEATDDARRRTEREAPMTRAAPRRRRGDR